MLIKRLEDYIFFKHTIEENRLRNELIWDYEWTQLEGLPLDATQYYSRFYFTTAGSSTLFMYGECLGNDCLGGDCLGGDCLGGDCLGGNCPISV